MKHMFDGEIKEENRALQRTSSSNLQVLEMIPGTTGIYGLAPSKYMLYYGGKPLLKGIFYS